MLELLRIFHHRDSRFFLLLQRITIGGLRIDLHERLKRSARMHFDSLSLLKVESTVCFQRKRRRERAVTRERYISFSAKNLKSLPTWCSPVVRLYLIYSVSLYNRTTGASGG